MKGSKHMRHHYKQFSIYFALILGLGFSSPVKAQQRDSLGLHLSLEECIAYATNQQPFVQQAKIDEAITERIIKSKLADWYPQINLGYNVQHYLQQPSVTNPLALKNSSTSTVSFTQNIFNSDVWLASKTAGDVRLASRQNTQLSKIDMVVGVSKAFYDVLLTQRQIEILDQDILRLQKTLKDATTQYQAGTADKTDYERATITVNNAMAAKKQYEELLKGKLAFLKQQMGYTGSEALKLDYNNQKLGDEIQLNPIDPLSYQTRVEFQQLKTQKDLLQYNLKYTKWSYLPTVSLFGYYNLVGQNNTLSKIYTTGFPNSL